MKKKYVKPEIKVYDIEPTQLLCGSPDRTTLIFGEGYPEDDE